MNVKKSKSCQRRDAVAALRNNGDLFFLVENPKQHPASAHIPCGFPARQAEEAHGICALAYRCCKNIQ